MPRLSEIGGRRLPFLRWSVVRLIFGLRRLENDWQVGDGREQAVLDYVLANAREGDIDDVIRAIDEFAVRRSVLINVGEEKGEILDRAVERTAPALLLELGTYVGYSGLRMARVMPEGAKLYSVEFSHANAAIARRMWQHAGAADRLDVVVGSLGDGGATIELLESECGFGRSALDFAFLDHDKKAYLPDLARIVERGWLRPGAVVVADNVRFPGAPEYRAHMKAQEGAQWRTAEHRAHVEYQSLLTDLVLESEYLDARGGT